MPAILITQAVTPAVQQSPPPILVLKFTDADKPCALVDSEDVIVCGRRDDRERYRLRPLDSARFEKGGKAETTLIGDLKGAAEVESREIGPGMTSNRIMFRLKLPF